MTILSNTAFIKSTTGLEKASFLNTFKFIFLSFLLLSTHVRAEIISKEQVEKILTDEIKTLEDQLNSNQQNTGLIRFLQSNHAHITTILHEQFNSTDTLETPHIYTYIGLLISTYIADYNRQIFFVRSHTLQAYVQYIYQPLINHVLDPEGVPFPALTDPNFEAIHHPPENPLLPTPQFTYLQPTFAPPAQPLFLQPFAPDHQLLQQQALQQSQAASNAQWDVAVKEKELTDQRTQFDKTFNQLSVVLKRFVKAVEQAENRKEKDKEQIETAEHEKKQLEVKITNRQRRASSSTTSSQNDETEKKLEELEGQIAELKQNKAQTETDLTHFHAEIQRLAKDAKVAEEQQKEENTRLKEEVKRLNREKKEHEEKELKRKENRKQNKKRRQATEKNRQLTEKEYQERLTAREQEQAEYQRRLEAREKELKDSEQLLQQAMDTINRFRVEGNPVQNEHQAHLEQLFQYNQDLLVKADILPEQPAIPELNNVAVINNAPGFIDKEAVQPNILADRRGFLIPEAANALPLVYQYPMLTAMAITTIIAAGFTWYYWDSLMAMLSLQQSSDACNTLKNPQQLDFCMSLNSQEQHIYNQLAEFLPHAPISHFKHFSLGYDGRLHPAKATTKTAPYGPAVKTLLMPVRQKFLAELTAKQSATFLSTVLPELAKLATVREQLNGLVLLGKSCGLLPNNLLSSCVQSVGLRMQKEGVTSVLNQISVLPSQPLHYLTALNTNDSFALLPVWQDAFETPLTLIPVTNDHGSLQIINMDTMPVSQGVESRETAEQTLKAFTHSITGELKWVEINQHWHSLAGLLQLMYNKMGGVYITDSTHSPFDSYSASHQGRVLNLAWLADPKQSGTINRLLLSDRQYTQNPVSAELQQWSKECHSSPYACLLPTYHLHKGAEKVQDDETEALLRNPLPALHYVPDDALFAFSSLTPKEQKLWLNLLDYSYLQSSLPNLHVDLNHYAHQTRQLCGMFYGKFKEHHLFACMQEVSKQIFSDHEGKPNSSVRRFYEGFPSGIDNKLPPQQALIALWNVNNAYSLSTPRFIPALQKGVLRQVQTEHRNSITRIFKLPSQNYHMMQLMSDYSLEKVVGFPDIYPREILFSINSGSYVLVSEDESDDTQYVLHQANPYLADPLPGTSAQTQLHDPTHVYPLNQHSMADLKKGALPDVARSVTHFEQGEYGCSSFGPGVFVNTCEELQAEGQYDAIEVLFITLIRHIDNITVPTYKLIVGSHDLDSVQHIVLDDKYNFPKSLIAKEITRLRKKKLLTKDMLIRARVHLFEYLPNLSSAFIKQTIVKSLETMKLYHIGFRRDEIVRDILNFCGLMGEPLHGLCRHKVIRMTLKKSFHPENRLIQLYRQSFTKKSYDKTTDTEGTNDNDHSKLFFIMDWYIGQKLELAESPSFVPAHFSDDGSITPQSYREVASIWKQPFNTITIQGLLPDTRYQLWVYDYRTGKWTTFDLLKSPLHTASDQTEIELSIPVDEVIGISQLAEDTPDSFISIKQREDRAFGVVRPAWEQNILAVPASTF